METLKSICLIKMSFTRFLLQIAGFVCLVSLPFIVLVRGSVYLHEQHHFLPSFAIIGGTALTFVILFIYLTFFYGRVYGHPGGHGSFKRRGLIVLIVLVSYLGYGLLYLSGKNAKSPVVAREFRSLHPILRLGVSTILLIDRDLIVTDANRIPEDYGRMGLRQSRQSLHYRQKNGYVHALDIRTHGRSGFRNFLLKWYFRGMGFHVLRHGGTGDHLHISLISHDRPYAM